MKVYRVWIEIEEYDGETEEGITVPFLDIASTATFDNPEDARRFALALHAQAPHAHRRMTDDKEGEENSEA
jgi:hypothetical protein